MSQIQKKILNFLQDKDNESEQISISELSKRLQISYPSVLKHCDILFAEGKIELKDYGNIKLVKKKNAKE